MYDWHTKGTSHIDEEIMYNLYFGLFLFEHTMENWATKKKPRLLISNQFDSN